MKPGDGPRNTRKQLLEQCQQAEQSVRDSAAQLQAVINTAVDGIIAISEQGIIEWLNPAALRIFGYQSQELIGRNVALLMPQPYHSQHDQYLRNYLQTGQARIIGIGREVQGQRKDGSVFPLDLAVSEVKLGSRRLFTGIVRDITLRKEAERALLQAKQAAEAANQVKDHFLAMVGHELRTPLNPILAAVSYLENQPDVAPEVLEEIAIIRRNVEHEARLVEDLLSLSRLVRGTIDLHYEAVDLHAVARTVLSHLEAAMDQKDLELTTSLRAKAHHVWADPNRLQQVLSNLLINAIQFNHEAGHVGLRTWNPQEGRLAIEVSDSGIGIDAARLQRLFQPFEPAEPNAAGGSGRLGLGLAISKAIVDLHGGQLLARSEGPNQGAAFTLELANVPPVPAEPAPPPSAKQPQSLRRVLLVEDHKDTLRIMLKLLRNIGYSVVSATTAQEALRLAERESFDVLVSDIGLPDGSGLDIMRAIKAKHAIKGIAVSGFGQPEDFTRSREAGFIDHLVKPVNFGKLQMVLKQITAAELGPSALHPS